MKHGKGKFTYANGNIYEGVWIYGNKYENGDKYKGGKDDERNGKDILYLNDGNICEGNRKEDVKEEEEEKVIDELNINESKQIIN